MWIDIHAHLYDIDSKDLRDVIDRARADNVTAVVNAAIDTVTSEAAVKQAAMHRGLYVNIGVSPFNVEGLETSWEEKLRSLVSNKAVIAIGEIGLDDSGGDYPSLEKQTPVFERQLALAVETNLPAVIHSRGAERRVLDYCRSMGLEKALFHCYTGDMGVLRDVLNAGYYVSFSGIITFKVNNCAELLSYTPLERLFIETDSPYLSPAPYRGQRNEPARVSLIGKRVSEVKKLTDEQTAHQIATNFNTLFGRRAFD
jgi:TatD DNase family protein